MTCSLSASPVGQRAHPKASWCPIVLWCPTLAKSGDEEGIQTAPLSVYSRIRWLGVGTLLQLGAQLLRNLFFSSVWYQNKFPQLTNHSRGSSLTFSLVFELRHPGLGTPHGADSIFTGDLPYLHIAGQVLLLALPMLNKSTSVIVTMHKDQEYKFSRFLRAVDKYKVKTIWAFLKRLRICEWVCEHSHKICQCYVCM